MAKSKVTAPTNPTLRFKLIKDGKIRSFYLDYYYYDAGKVSHKKTFLKLYVLDKPKTRDERAQVDEITAEAEMIRQERAREFRNNKYGYKTTSNLPVNFITYFQNYINNYTKKDKRNVIIALNRFKDFLKDTPRYKCFVPHIEPQQLDKDMMIAFTDYLKSRSKGEGAHSIYQRFKKVINNLIDHDIIQKNPCQGITIRTDRNAIKKLTLSIQEIAQLESTHYPCENPTIQKAFIFCCFAGLRYCDVKDITYRNVDYSNRSLQYDQAKTKDTSAHSWVAVPLTDKLLGLIGELPEDGDYNKRIFPLPSIEACNKALKRWTAKAGITQHITWHCGRHSLATNAIRSGVNPVIVQKLMGHSDIRDTLKYVTVSDEQKIKAMEDLCKPLTESPKKINVEALF